MTSLLPSSLLSRVLTLTQQLPFSLPLPSLRTLRSMGTSWSDSIDASITIQADPALVLALLEAAANDPLYAHPNTVCFTPHSPKSQSRQRSPSASPSSPTTPLSPNSPLKQPASPPTPASPSTPVHSSTVRLLLPYLFDDTHTFSVCEGADGGVTLEQREVLSGVVVWLGRVCRLSWYADMLEETRSGYEQWNEAIKRMAEEQMEEQRMQLEAH